MLSDIGHGHFCSFLVFFAHLHSQDGSMADWSLFIHGSIDVPWVNWFRECHCGDLVCVDERDITVDAFGSTVKYCMCIDFSPVAYDSNFNPN